MEPIRRANRIETIFEAALELDRAERESYLAAVCGDDPGLRDEVEALLRSFEAAHTDDLLPPFAREEVGAALIGKQIGPYRILRLIAEGGMGAVYLAEREDVGMQAALKLIRYGGLASAEHVQRFLLERRVLARLRHPGIARLLDAGITPDQLPYLIMEYVEGETLDRYCDQRRLPIEERLRLFLQVCTAVQYAHRSLIIHRDLKPSNILVDENGRVKLLDFGIAKLLERDAAAQPSLTRLGGVPLTPEYASPEQVRGEPVTTASDVYSLGIILYELISGHRPYRLRSQSPAELERLVCSAVPSRPSTAVLRTEEIVHADGAVDRVTPAAVSVARRTDPQRLRRRLDGDLDTIVLKALQKEPERRFASVQELADDLERHLAGKPVHARGDTLGYLAGKFVLRHRVGVAAAVAVLASLVIGLSLAVWQSREATRQRDLAVDVANAMIFDLAEGLSRMTGPTESRLGLLVRAVDVFERIGSGRAVKPEHGRRAADGYRVLAQTYSTLGDTERALQYATRAEQEARRLSAAARNSDEDRLPLAGALLEVGDALIARGRGEEGVAKYTEAVAVLGSLREEVAESADARRIYYLVLMRKGDWLFDKAGELSQAEELYWQAFALSEQLLQHAPTSSQNLGFHATIRERLADVLYYSGQVEESCVGYREALRVRQDAAAAADADVTTLRTLAISMQNVGWCSEREGEIAETIRLYSDAAALQRRLVESDPSNTVLAANLIGGLGELATTLRAQGKLDEAVRRYREALEVGSPFLEPGAVNPRVATTITQILPLLAESLISLGRSGDAARELGRAEELLTELIAQHPASVDYRRARADVLLSTGDLQRRRGAVAASIDAYREALAAYRQVAQTSGLSTDRQLLAFSHYKLAMALQTAAELAQAREELLQGRRILLELRAAGQLSDQSDGFRRYLPAIEQELASLGR